VRVQLHACARDRAYAKEMERDRKEQLDRQTEREREREREREVRDCMFLRRAVLHASAFRRMDESRGGRASPFSSSGSICIDKFT